MPLRSRQACDDFQSPPEALKPLHWYLPKDKVIWEPAMGKGNLVKELRRLGFKVVGSDIAKGKDFLGWLPGEDKQPKPLGEVIVTNPPYSKKDKFLNVAFSLGIPFAFLMPLTALGDSVKRIAWYRKKGISVIVLQRRLMFETPYGRPLSPLNPLAWFAWGLPKLEKNKIVWSPF